MRVELEMIYCSHSHGADPCLCELFSMHALHFLSVQGCTNVSSCHSSFVTKIENCATSSSLVLPSFFKSSSCLNSPYFLSSRNNNMTTNSVHFYQSVFMYLFIFSSSFTGFRSQSFHVVITRPNRCGVDSVDVRHH